MPVQCIRVAAQDGMFLTGRTMIPTHNSTALLMAALQFVHVPGYAALILRKDTQRLSLAGGLMPRSHEWLAPAGVQWNATRRQWSFPAGLAPATITFGYLDSPLDKYRYASSEYQLIAFDELTELAEADYLFLFSRLRKPTVLDAPLRVRSASNPGNVGHLWVKQRFIDLATAESESCVSRQQAQWKVGRSYIPSRIADNPFLNGDEYRQSLAHLPPIERERLMNGDWSVVEQGLIRAEWLRDYVCASGDQLELLAPDGRLLSVVRPERCRRFITVDPAGTSADRMREARGREASWTVAQVWDQPRQELSRFLILRHQVRERVGFDGLCALLRKLNDEWEPERIWIENEKLGQASVDVLQTEMPIECIRTRGRDKSARASRLIDKLQRGEIYLPKYDTAWRPAFEAELLSWTGRDDQPADQIDAAAYAAIVSHEQGPGILVVESLVQRS
ncbi:MAG: hypothetical protein WD872_15450 [Pirellulaceae bacterium]